MTSEASSWNFVSRGIGAHTAAVSGWIGSTERAQSNVARRSGSVGLGKTKCPERARDCNRIRLVSRKRRHGKKCVTRLVVQVPDTNALILTECADHVTDIALKPRPFRAVLRYVMPRRLRPSRVMDSRHGPRAGDLPAAENQQSSKITSIVRMPAAVAMSRN